MPDEGRAPEPHVLRRARPAERAGHQVLKFTSGGGKTELDIIMQEMAGRPGPGPGHYGDTGAAYKCEGSQKFAMASRDPPTLSDKRPTPGPIHSARNPPPEINREPCPVLPRNSKQDWKSSTLRLLFLILFSGNRQIPGLATGAVGHSLFYSRR